MPALVVTITPRSISSWLAKPSMPAPVEWIQRSLGICSRDLAERERPVEAPVHGDLDLGEISLARDAPQRQQRDAVAQRLLDARTVLVEQHARQGDDRHGARPSSGASAPTRMAEASARRASSSSGMWQRSLCPSLVARQGGSTSSQIGPTFHGQRSANGHALGGREEAAPGSPRTAAETGFSPSISGTAESSMCVYGW